MRGRMWSRLAGVLVAGLGLAILPLAIAGPADAAEACAARTLSQPFTSWGDYNSYFPMTSGTFESGTSGWGLGAGASRVAENEPWHVAGNGAYSLRVPAGVSVTTPEMCVATTEDSVRFFYKASTVGSLMVQVRVTSPNGSSIWTNMFSINSGGGGWQVSPRIPLPDVRGEQGWENLQITLTPQSAAAWQFDDVFVDPSRTL